MLGKSGKVAMNLRQHESFLQLEKKAKRSKHAAGEVGGGETERGNGWGAREREGSLSGALVL